MFHDFDLGEKKKKKTSPGPDISEGLFTPEATHTHTFLIHLHFLHQDLRVVSLVNIFSVASKNLTWKQKIST